MGSICGIVGRFQSAVGAAVGSAVGFAFAVVVYLLNLVLYCIHHLVVAAVAGVPHSAACLVWRVDSKGSKLTYGRAAVNENKVLYKYSSAT